MDAIEKPAAGYPRVVSKPVGGFRAVGLLQICMAWWAYRTGVLREYLDFRVYLALHEFDEQRLTARRVRAKNRLPSSPSRLSRPALVGEVQGLVASSSERLVRASLARLEDVGFVVIGETGTIFATNLSHLRLDDKAPKVTELQHACRGCEASTRRLPVPRLMLRHIARGASPAVAATVMGHLIRSVTWVDKEIRVSGSCTAGFISDFFGLDLRSVRRARACLREMGWLVLSLETDTNSSGGPNLAWSPKSRRDAGRQGARVCTDLSLLRPESRTEMSAPTYSSQLRSGSSYLQPAGGGLPGICEGDWKQGSASLSHVVGDDLRDARRLLALFEQAATNGLVKRTEADRLRFFAAAERAKRLGTRNPCGFFAAIVRGGRWKVLSQRDEDLAHEVLKKLESSADLRVEIGPPGSSTAASLLATDKGSEEIAHVRTLVSRLAARCSITPSTASSFAKPSRTGVILDDGRLRSFGCRHAVETVVAT